MIYEIEKFQICKKNQFESAINENVFPFDISFVQKGFGVGSEMENKILLN